MASEEVPPAHASADDIRRAIASLSPEDLLRLRRAAEICLPGTAYRNPMELINEVVLRAMHAANGQKGRRWPLRVPFMAFMIQTFDGLADDSRQSQDQRLTDHIEAMAADGGDGGEALMRHGHFHPDPETEQEEEEDRLQHEASAKAAVDKIDAFFLGDQDVTWIIMGYRDQMSPADIMSLGDMTQSQYEAARKRFRRGLHKLFPDGRSS